jgi:DNA-binding transcriptional ArsR family regulator
MSSLIETLQERTGTANESPRVLGVAENETDDVLNALASDTSRALFRTLYDEPGTPSEIADRCDTSVQNVHYHVSNLEDAELIEPVETVYSSKGNEMTVYGPASDPIVLVGDCDLEPRLQQSMADVVTGLGLIGFASLFVQWGAEKLATATAGDEVLAPASPNAGPVSGTNAVARFVFEVIEPGLLFFCLCLTVLGIAALLADGEA